MRTLLTWFTRSAEPTSEVGNTPDEALAKQIRSLVTALSAALDTAQMRGMEVKITLNGGMSGESSIRESDELSVAYVRRIDVKQL